jgi:hypothetical protein
MLTPRQKDDIFSISNQITQLEVSLKGLKLSPVKANNANRHLCGLRSILNQLITNS